MWIHEIKNNGGFMATNTNVFLSAFLKGLECMDAVSKMVDFRPNPVWDGCVEVCKHQENCGEKRKEKKIIQLNSAALTIGTDKDSCHNAEDGVEPLDAN